MKTLLEVFMKIRVCLVKHLVKYVYSTIPDILNIFRHPCRLSVDFSFSRPAWIFTGQKNRQVYSGIIFLIPSSEQQKLVITLQQTIVIGFCNPVTFPKKRAPI